MKLRRTTQSTDRLARHDGLKRNTTTTDPLAVSTTLSYNAVALTQRVDGESQITSYENDKRNRLVTVTYDLSLPETRTYTYDKVGNILTVTEADSKADVAYTWDALNRTITETSAGETHSYKYDLAGNVRLVDYGGTGRTIASDYNELNWLVQLDETLGAVTRTTAYTYDLNGNTLTKTLPGNQTTTQVYDELNRVTQIANGAATYDQVWGLAGNLISVEESYPGNASLDRAVTNSYDDIYRLVEELIEDAPGGNQIKKTTFGYDDANNRTAKTVVTTGTVNFTYAYNAANQMTSWTDGTLTVAYTFDANGNRATKNDGTTATAYEYDYENRLVEVTVGSEIYGYIYDYRTRRVERDELGTATRIVFSGGVSVLEFDSSDVLQVEFVRGSGLGGGIGSILYSVRGGVASLTNYNHRGDVVSKTTDAGAVTYQAEYEAFGEHPVETGSTPDRQKANTKEEDPTGLLNEGFRYRDLETGEFITRDPLGFVDGPNLYAYVNQNPWTGFDPLGLEVKYESKRLEAVVTRMRQTDKRLDKMVTTLEQKGKVHTVKEFDVKNQMRVFGEVRPNTGGATEPIKTISTFRDSMNGKGVSTNIYLRSDPNDPYFNEGRSTSSPESLATHEFQHAYDNHTGTSAQKAVEGSKWQVEQIIDPDSGQPETEQRAVRTQNIYEEKVHGRTRDTYGGKKVTDPGSEHSPLNEGPTQAPTSSITPRTDSAPQRSQRDILNELKKMRKEGLLE